MKMRGWGEPLRNLKISYENAYYTAFSIFSLKGGLTLEFEIRDRDAGARLGRFKVKGRVVETPLFLPVYNPNIPIITPNEMRERYGFKAIMTNAYIIYKNEALREKALKEGIHGFLNFDGVVFTDSGAYQSFRGELELKQEEIVKFQENIGVDVGVMLDVPSRGESFEECRESVIETAKRGEEWSTLRSRGEIAWEGVIQGGAYPELLELSCKLMSKFDFDIFAVGVPPKYWMSYDFELIAIQGLNTRMNISPEKPLHAFGMGNPLVLSLLVAIGYDVFDSASYAIYAKDGRYMTEWGVKRIEELDYLPCDCPVCLSIDAGELKIMAKDERVKLLARHNLYMILREMNAIKQAIRENRLWELVQQRARAHPKLLESLIRVFKDGWNYFKAVDPIRKRAALFYSGEETTLRPELRRALERVKERLGCDRIPSALSETYPFGQSILKSGILNFDGKSYDDLEKIRIIADYQFGSDVGLKLIPEDVFIEKSKRTGRIRRIWLGDVLIGALRPSDGFISLSLEGALRLKKILQPPKYRVYVSGDDKLIQMVKSGGDVFSRFVAKCDLEIVPKEEVIVVDQDDSLLAVGQAVLAGFEMGRFRRGVAVKVRKGVEE
jgi:7-cyano-7-deazaguanine tRNA-ribosyltransferase